MRDLTKSMLSYGWAMSVFGVQQILNLMTPGQGGDPCGKAAKAFNDVTQATTGTLDNSMKSAFTAGDKMQSGFVDMMFGGFMGAGMDPSRWMRMGNEMFQRTAQTVGAAAAGAGAPGAAPSSGPAGGTTGPTTASGAGWGPMPS